MHWYVEQWVRGAPIVINHPSPFISRSNCCCNFQSSMRQWRRRLGLTRQCSIRTCCVWWTMRSGTSEEEAAPVFFSSLTTGYVLMLRHIYLFYTPSLNHTSLFIENIWLMKPHPLVHREHLAYETTPPCSENSQLVKPHLLVHREHLAYETTPPCS